MISSITNIKSLLGITATTYDTLLTRLLNVANDLVTDYCNRNFEAQDYTTVYDGDSVTLNYILEDAPLNSITSVTVDSDTLTDGTDYEKYADSGMIHFYTAPSKDRKNITIVYNAGYTTVPYDVQQAVDDIVVSMFNKRKAKGIASERIGNYSVTYGKGINSDEFASVKNTLDRYVINQDPNKFRV